MISTLTSPQVVAAIADLADVDPIVVPPPQIVHAVSNGEIARLLPPNLLEVPGATGSHGAYLRADLALSVADPEDRARQVIRWLCQITADAGLSGMERLTRTELPAPSSLPSRPRRQPPPTDTTRQLMSAPTPDRRTGTHGS
jgi:hypothetical protein